MTVLRLEVVDRDDSHFPGWFTGVVVDASGIEHRFEEKVPMFWASDETQRAWFGLRCEVRARWRDERGLEVAEVFTGQPDGVVSLSGLVVFTVPAASVYEDAEV